MSDEKPDYKEVFPLVLDRPNIWRDRGATMYAMTGSAKPVFGEYVMIGFRLAPLLYRIGYVVQVRLGQGNLGSDLYLLRHCNGEVVQHANNMFLPLTPGEIEIILPCFGDVEPSAEGEDPSYGIGVPGSFRKGFIIDQPDKPDGMANKGRSYG